MFGVYLFGTGGGDYSDFHKQRRCSVEHRPALMGRSPVRTTKTSCSRDLLFDLSILSVSFSNDLAVQTFMPSLLFWAMIGCSSKLRSALCDGCISLTFISPQPRQPPMNLLWCDPCKKTFHADLSSNPFFSSHIIPFSPSNTNAFELWLSFAWKAYV